MARAVRPVHAMTDGDVVFALATGTRPLGGPGRAFGADSRPGRLGELMAAAADAVSRAVVAGVLAAAPGVSPPTYRQHYPSSRPVAP
jgi:putative pantetheine hydrolase